MNKAEETTPATDASPDTQAADSADAGLAGKLSQSRPAPGIVLRKKSAGTAKPRPLPNLGGKTHE